MNSLLKVDPKQLPVPKLEPTRPVRVDITPDGYKRSIVVMKTWEEAHTSAQKRPHKGGASKGLAKVWTKERNEIIRSMWAEGKSVDEIADALHMERSRVENRIDKMRTQRMIPGRKREGEWKENEVSKLIELYTAGVSYETISKELGRSKSACSAKLSALRKAGEFDDGRGDVYHLIVRHDRCD
jgi:predicted transcriptional regulator